MAPGRACEPCLASNKRVIERGCQRVRRHKDREKSGCGNMYEKKECSAGE